jgi:hypothetical protein
MRALECRPPAQRRRCHRHYPPRPYWAASRGWIDNSSKLGCYIGRHSRCDKWSPEQAAWAGASLSTTPAAWTHPSPPAPLLSPQRGEKGGRRG